MNPKSPAQDQRVERLLLAALLTLAALLVVYRLARFGGQWTGGDTVRMASARPLHTFGLARSARSVEDVERFVPRDCNALGRLSSALKGEPIDVSLAQFSRLLLALQDHAELGLMDGLFDRIV